METYKIDHFIKNNPADHFPWFRSLTESETREIVVKLALSIGNQSSEDSLTLVKRICQMSEPLSELTAENNHFSLSSVLERCKIYPLPNVFINWYRFDIVDEIHFDDLNKYFGDIWYPGVDDIDIFDATLSWIISVQHNGQIRFAQLGGQG